VISKKIVLVLSLCVAGSFVQLQGATCGATLDTWVAAGATGCVIDGLTFYNFGWTPTGSNSSPAGGLPDTEVDVTTLLNSNGVGFLLTPTVAWGAGGAGYTDGELTFIVKTTSGASTLNHIYQQIDGTVAGTGSYDDVLEQYCVGGTSLPPCGPPTPQLDSRIGPTGCNVGAADGSGGCDNSVSFGGVSSIAVLKDIRGDATAGASGANVTLTGVINQFGPAVPEPGTYLLSFIGLGLLFLGRRNFSRS
jgi:hypothetical protein